MPARTRALITVLLTVLGGCGTRGALPHHFLLDHRLLRCRAEGYYCRPFHCCLPPWFAGPGRGSVLVSRGGQFCCRSTLLLGIAPLEPIWAQWFGTGRTREQALERQLEPAAAAFEHLFATKKHQLLGGFSLVAWNGQAQGSTTGLTLTCGLTSRTVCNVCTLNPPRDGAAAQRILTSTVMASTLRAMALAWELEWGIATSEAHRDETLKTTEPGTFMGWVMYFSRRRGSVPPVRVEPVEDKGTLIILTPERFTARSPEHVALAARVRELLDRAGLLSPLQVDAGT